jgi:aspartate aminotransferase
MNLLLLHLFTEYCIFVKNCRRKLVVVPPNMKDFQIDFEAFEGLLLTEHTKSIIMNSPNNPSRVAYSEETIIKFFKIFSDKSKEYEHTIYLIADEPYRENIYNDLVVPYCIK